MEPAVALRPDLITVSAGGNDVLRPGVDPDAIAARLGTALARLAGTDATLVLFTGVDVRFSPVLRRIRGRVAVSDELLRGLAARHGALVADQWSLTAIQSADRWCEDRLHLNPSGHHEVARMVLTTLGVEHGIEPGRPSESPHPTWRRARADDLVWTGRHVLPWVGRRIRGVSSGDTILPKGPYFLSDDRVATSAAGA